MTPFRYRWYAHACFDELCWRDEAGKVCFAGQHATAGRHRDRIWPALSRYKRAPLRRRQRWQGPRQRRATKAIEQASQLTVLRRWCPLNPLEAWHGKQCDLAQRPPRYDW